MKTRLTLTMDDAKAIATAAEAEARRNGWAVSIAVCDAGGHLLWLQRMEDAPLMSAQIAPGKAHGAVVARKPTKAIEDMINGGRYAALGMPVMPLEGGEMVVIEGDLAGGVGVSGVLSAQDAQVARAGIAALGGSRA